MGRKRSASLINKCFLPGALSAPGSYSSFKPLKLDWINLHILIKPPPDSAVGSNVSRMHVAHNTANTGSFP